MVITWGECVVCRWSRDKKVSSSDVDRTEKVYDMIDRGREAIARWMRSVWSTTIAGPRWTRSSRSSPLNVCGTFAGGIPLNGDRRNSDACTSQSYKDHM